MSRIKGITRMVYSALSIHRFKLVAALSLLVVAQGAYAQSARTLVEEFPLKRSADSEVTLPNFKGQIWSDGSVIPPFITEFKSRDYAANANFCFGVIPPKAILGRSLL